MRQSAGTQAIARFEDQSNFQAQLSSQLEFELYEGFGSRYLLD